MAHLQRPLILRRGGPCQVGSGRRLNIARLRAPAGKQRGHEPKRINFGTQAHQILLFFTQHFIDVFHSRQTGPAKAVQQFSRDELRVAFRLDYADCNTPLVQTAILKRVNLQLRGRDFLSTGVDVAFPES